MSEPIVPAETSSSHAALLCVDLDGTLVATDTLDESLLRLVRERPLLLVLLPFWLLRGKAYFKHRVATATNQSLGKLPLNREVVDFVRTNRSKYSEVVLVTAAHVRIAREVSPQFGFISHFLASDECENLSGVRKRKAIERYAAGRRFDYLGDSMKDLPVWEAARYAYVVDGAGRLARRIDKSDGVVQLLPTPSADLAGWRRQLRIHQWSKNLLLAVPLVTAHQLTNLPAVATMLLAILVFSFVASAVYLTNDLLDLPFDRGHPTKSKRPLAAGEITIRQAVVAAALLLINGMLLSAILLPADFTLMLFGYFALSLIYSLVLKQYAVVDVVMLAMFYAFRVLIGGVAVGIRCSPWLLAFALFFFLSLALLKRYAELELCTKHGIEVPEGRSYVVTDAPTLRSFGVSASAVAALVIVLYLQSENVFLLYTQPEWLWLVCPLVHAWSMRVWMLASRGDMDDDPVVFALRDKGSYVLGAIVMVLLFIATGVPG